MNRRSAEPEAVAVEPGAAVTELPTVAAPERDDDDDDEDDELPPIGDPFTLSSGCDLLQVTPGVAGVSPGIPGCFASVRCDCGRCFKVDLLSTGPKPCPGCRILYSHVLLVAPCDDRDIVGEFYDAVEGPEGDDDDDDDDQGDDDDDQGDDGPA